MKQKGQEALKKLHSGEYIKKYHREDRVRIKRLIKKIKFSKTDTILDLGCGNGLLMNQITTKIKSYHGIDFSKGFIEEADKNKKKLNATNVKLVCGDIIEYCNKNKNRFDKIFALDFTEHIYDDNFIKIFSAVYNSMKKEGVLFVHTPNREYALEILKEKGIMKQFPEHIGIRNAEQYKKLLMKSGFKNIELMYLPHYIKILSSLDFLKYIPYFGKYFKARLFIKCKK